MGKATCVDCRDCGSCPSEQKQSHAYSGKASLVERSPHNSASVLIRHQGPIAVNPRIRTMYIMRARVQDNNHRFTAGHAVQSVHSLDIIHVGNDIDQPINIALLEKCKSTNKRLSTDGVDDDRV